MERIDRDIARGAAAGDKAADKLFAIADRSDAGVLDKGRRAAGVELDELFDMGEEIGGHDHPAEPPTGHRPVFRKTVNNDQPVVRLRLIEKRRRRPVAVDDAAIDFVADQPHAAAAREIEERGDFRGRDHPAGRV